MAKAKSRFVCQECGYSQTGWSGKCPECEAWGSLVEEIVSAKQNGSQGRSSSRKKASKAITLSDVKAKDTKRIDTKISEFNRVLGGGLLGGQVVLIAGEPGIGKSTILLQIASKLKNTLYVSGEESPRQIKIRADRLGIKDTSLKLLDETDVDEIIATASAMTDLSCLVVDSIQTMTTGDLRGMPGSVGQVKEVSYRLVRFAKAHNVPVFIVGHVTKAGSVAGPSLLAHIVDTVLWFEGDKNMELRLLRAHKNRFGPTDEVGIFSMEEKGLASVDDAGGLFLSEEKKKEAGSAITSIMEGTRPILVEIQSLVVPTKLAYPRRIAQGIDSSRLELMIAVLTKKCKIPLSDFDVYVNVVGGIKVKEPACDLAVCMSIASSFFDKKLPSDLVAFGEVGLLGEIRRVQSGERRAKEAKRQGYKKIASSEANYLNVLIKKYLS